MLLNAWVEPDGCGGIKKRNWGDDINFYLLSAITGHNWDLLYRTQKQSKEDDLLFIGSVMSLVRPTTVIWGAGVKRADFKLPNIPKRICSVRGPRTRQCLIEQGIDCPEVYGDPALLLPLVYKPACEKKYRVSIIAHYRDWDLPHVKSFRDNHPEVNFISMRDYDDWHSVIDQIVASDIVVSSSLHGLIAADAYGIANVWAEFSDAMRDEILKYYDYAEGVNRILNEPLDFRLKIDLSRVQDVAKNWRPIDFDAQKLLAVSPDGVSISIKKGLRMNSVKVSVIVPVYNVEPYIEECLNSIVSQTLKNIEVICVDDGSTDGSLAVLKSFASKDSRIKVIEQENLGPGPARNRALDMARGEWIAFMDPDDFYPANNTLERMLTAAELNEVKIAGGSLRRLVNGEIESNPEKLEKGYVFDKDEKKTYKDYQFDYGYWRFIYKRDFLDDNAIRFPDYRRQQDPPFMVKAFALAGTFFAMSEPTYVYRKSTNKQPEWDERRTAGFFSGIRDVVKYASEFNLKELYLAELARLRTVWFTNAITHAAKYRAVREVVIDLVSCIMQSRYYGRSMLIDDRFVSLYDSRDTGVVVSVIVPVYNVEKYLQRCLDSILAQTYPWIEVICVDDGSVDSSPDILSQYAAKDGRIKVLTKSNGGLSSARNFALPHVRGRYVMFVDSDDYIAPETVDHAVAKMFDETDVVCWGAQLIDDGVGSESPFFVAAQKYHTIKNVGLKRVDWALMSSIPVTVWNKLFKMSIIRKIGFSFAEGLLFEDNDFHFVYMSRCRKAYCLNEYNYYYNQRPGSIMQRFCSGDCVESVDLIKMFDRLYRFFLEDGRAAKYERFLRKRFELQLNKAIDRTPRAYKYANLEVVSGLISDYPGAFGDHCRKCLLIKRKELNKELGVKVLFVVNGGGNKITSNTFVSTLADALRKEGLTVDCGIDLFWNSKPGDYDIIHLQWPEAIIGWKSENATDEFIQNFRNRLNELRRAGAKFVYTRHNRRPHKIAGENINKLTEIFETNADVIIHMGETSQRECLEAYPNSAVRHVVIPHHLKDEIDFSISREEARAKLGISADAKVMLSFGAFRHEEEVALVKAAVNGLDIQNFKLLAPLCPGDTYKGLVPDAELPTYFAAADIVFLQRVRVLNSGVLPLAYDAARVCVGPADGNAGEILAKTENPVFDPSDIESVKTAIINGFELADKGLGSKNRIFARKHWTPQQVAVRHSNLYYALTRKRIVLDGFIDIVDGKPLMRNWGDELNWYLLKHLTSLPIVLAKNSGNRTPGDLRLLFIGSGSDACKFDERSVVWGAGSLYADGIIKYRPRCVAAVRGPLTRKKFIAAGVDCPEIYGDPALLLPQVYQPKVIKSYKVGVAIHFREWYLPHVEEFRKSHPEILFIDMGDYRKWTEIPDKICSCEMLVSSSLHAIIVADAYGVPNVFVKFSTLVKGGTWKFRDYFAGVSRKFEEPLDFSKSISLAEVNKSVARYCHIKYDAEKFLETAPFMLTIRKFDHLLSECDANDSRSALLRRARLAENAKSGNASEISELSSAIKTLKQKKKAIETKKLLLQKEVASLRQSAAYRVGMFITWPARRVYRFLTRLRSNKLSKQKVKK